MGCCSAPEVDAQRSARAPQRFKKCQDVLFLLLLILSLGAGGYVTVRAYKLHRPIQIYGHDSFGNICGMDNTGEPFFQYIDGTEQLGNLEAASNLLDTSIHGLDRVGQSKSVDMRSSDILAISTSTILFSPGLTYCSNKCPGEDISDWTEDQYIELAVKIYMAHKTSLTDKAQIKTLIGSSPGITQNEADAAVDSLWCSSFLSDNGYSFGAADDFCVANPVLLPSNNVLGRCVPNNKLMSAILQAYLSQSGNMPAQSNSTSNDTSSFVSKEFGKVVDSFYIMQTEIIVSCICAIVVAMIIIFIIQVFTKYIVKVLVISFFLCSLGAIVWIWAAFYIKMNKAMGADAVNFKGLPLCKSLNETSDPTERIFWDTMCNEPAPAEEDVSKFKIVTYLVTVICSVMIITICCCWGNIALAVELFDEAGQAVFAQIFILFQPVVTAFFIILNYVFCFLFMTYCFQVKERVISEGGLVNFEGKSLAWEYAWLFILFNGFWVAVFMDGINDVTLAGSISTWFFSETRPKTMHCCPGFNAFINCVKYSLGSVAFGALLIAIIRTIQVIIWIIERQTQPPPGTEMGPARKALFACLKCCMVCVEKFLAFINRNAFIGIAVFGYDFCRSAQKCLALKVENAGRAATTAIICTGVLILGKLISMACTIAIFFAMGGGNPNFDSIEPVSKICLAILVGAVAFLITSIFLSVYEMALDTIFICFCEDQQRNNGKDRPYFSSARLQKFMRQNA